MTWLTENTSENILRDDIKRFVTVAAAEASHTVCLARIDVLLSLHCGKIVYFRGTSCITL